MRVGSLNRRIVLQRPTHEQDPNTGEMVRAWVGVATVWADVRYLNGLETVKSSAPVSVAKASIRIRHRSDIDATWRAMDGAVIFNILAVLPDAQGREYVDLACESGANNG